MLNGLRAIAKTWFGRILGAFLIVGLAGFGISNVLLDLGATNVANVGGEDISTRDFQRAYSNAVNQMANQTGTMPTAQQAVQMGIPSAVLNRLASDAAVNKFANTIGLGVSEDRLGKMLREDPSFAGTLGGFDRASFARTLQQAGFTEAEYFELQSRASRRQQVAAGLFGGSPVPQTALQLVNRYTGDTRSIDYFVIGAQNLPPVTEPTDDELKAYLTEHQADFRTKETRTADILVLSPEVLATSKTVGEDEIAAEYERTKASRVTVERRTIRQVALASEDQATQFEQGKAAGKSFDQLVTELSLTPTDLGTLAQTEVADASLAKAAFALQQGEYAVIPGIGNKRVITVSAIEPGREQTLTEAHDEIAKQLAVTQARQDIGDILDQVEELRAAFKPLKEIGTRFSIPVQTVALTADGAQLSAMPAIPEADRGKVSGSVFAAQQDKLTPAIQLNGSTTAWFDLIKIDAARDQTLDEVRDAVATAWTEEKTKEAVAAEVKAIVAELDAGKSFEDVAASRSQFPVRSEPLKRTGNTSPIISDAVAQAAFQGGPGHHGSAVNDDGDTVVFSVADIAPATGDAIPQAKDYVENETRDTLYADFVSGLRADTGMSINRKALDQVLAVDTSGT